MLATLVMTVIGADRPGLVQMVAARVADHGGNWLESRMCRLGGQFAGILRVEVAQGLERDDAAAVREEPHPHAGAPYRVRMLVVRRRRPGAHALLEPPCDGS